jgi:hypothetical protein
MPNAIKKFHACKITSNLDVLFEANIEYHYTF